MTQTPDVTDRDLELERVLALMRFAIAAFLLVWACDKLFGADRAIGTFSKYYASISNETLMMTIGAFQLALVLAFAAGVAKTFTYGAVTLMHAVSTFASFEHYLNPLARPSILFWAAIPVLAAMIALFVLRRRDRLFVLSTS